MMSGAGGIDICLKDNGIGVEMSPAAMIAQASLCSSNGRGQSSENSLDSTDPSRRYSISPTNLSCTPSNQSFRCERCDNFEANSRSSLLLHVVQCLSSPPITRLKTEENSADGMTDINARDSNPMKLSSQDSPLAKSVIVAPAKCSSNSTAATSSSTSRKVFECDVCNMKFSNGANMRRHKMRHTGVKPYECRVCQKRFFRKDHLAEHFTTHTKTLPYHCPICNRGFQRQIAMRAHFQNEHVGQHDLVKTCPLCSYRAGSMKSLRIHFFNRHGIDLDNPGASGTSSLLLALESQASHVAAAAAAAGFVSNIITPSGSTSAGSAVSANNNTSTSCSSSAVHHSDSGESVRSTENVTPPMCFLTPHVEISTINENASQLFNLQANMSNDSMDNVKDREFAIHSPVPPVQDQPLDCNTKALPSSTSNIQVNLSPKNHNVDNHITPSISLIPIKQEPVAENLTNDKTKSKYSNEQNNNSNMNNNNNNNNNNDNDNVNNNNNNSNNLNNNNNNSSSGGGAGAGGESSESEYSASNNIMTALIKVSPLKTLLREDLKRRICAKANNRISRNSTQLENNVQNVSGVINSSSNSTPICNGTITSSGQESESLMVNRKQILTCLFCGIEFPDETLYFLHKGCHCDSNPWKCNICGEQLNNVYEFNSHLLSKSHQ